MKTLATIDPLIVATISATVTANANRAAQDPCALAYLGEYNSSASAV